MTRKCCVPECRSNYEKPYITVFGFPSDPQRRSQWLRSIPRENLVISKNTVVCVKHFDQQYIITEDFVKRDDGTILTVKRDKPKLSDDAIPTIFPNLPTYLSKEVSVKRKTPEERYNQIMENDEAEFKRWCSRDSISSFEEFVEGLKKKPPNDWQLIFNPTYVGLSKFVFTSCLDVPGFILIDHTLKFSVYIKGKLMSDERLLLANGKNFFVKYWSQFDTILSRATSYMEEDSYYDKILACLDELEVLFNEIRTDPSKFKAFFLLEQLKSIFRKSKYSADSLMFSVQAYALSRSNYDFLRKTVLHLPHPSYIKKLLSNFKINSGFDDCQLKFLKESTIALQSNQKHVILLIDEIYIKSMIDYKNGNIVGLSENDPLNEAKTVLVFLIKNIFTNKKDIVGLYPVKNLKSDFLLEVTKKAIENIYKIGLNLLAIITDNNSVNRNMFMDLCGGSLKPFINNPFDLLSKIFIFFDNVHILKCIRNNWINQKDSEQTFVFPDFDNSMVSHRASFSHLKVLHDKELGSTAKLAPNLNYKTLYPNNYERQNVRLALNIFNEKNCAALKSFSGEFETDVSGTEIFISLFLKWWHMVNIRHPKQGIHLKLKDSEPFSSDMDERLVFFKKMILWLKHWTPQKQGSLSKETHISLTCTLEALVNLIPYCLNVLKFKYVLTGMFQTDDLEKRFSKYRQMSGGNYNISIRQILECEKKLKLMDTLQFKYPNKGNINLCKIDSIEHIENINEEINISPLLENVIFHADNVIVTSDEAKALYYISGYLIFNVKKHISCTFCISELTTFEKLQYEFLNRASYTDILDRGGLTRPRENFYDVVLLCYKIFQCAICPLHEDAFLCSLNQRAQLVKLFQIKIFSSDVNLIDYCQCGVEFRKIISKCLISFSNIVLNNYCKNKTNQITQAKSNYKKTKTFS